MVPSPEKSGKIIAGLADHVKINPKGVENLGNVILSELKSKKLSTDIFSQNNFHPKASDPWALDWLFVIDTLNFCFWKPEHEIGWQVEGQTGYFALCAAINRALKEGSDILKPTFYSKITEDELSHILRSDTKISVPLLKERVESLHQVGSKLILNFRGTFRTCLTLANNSAVQLVKMIVNNFPCFRDEAVYKGRHVAFYKRAQILVGDIWACYKNEGTDLFKDIEEITMFADYRVPQSLIYFGVLEYSSQLKEVLNTGILLKNGSDMEVEIRGCSIHAVELVKEMIKELIKKNGYEFEINSTLIDHFLWDFRRKHAEEILKMEIPFHKTLCIYY